MKTETVASSIYQVISATGLSGRFPIGCTKIGNAGAGVASAAKPGCQHRHLIHYPDRDYGLCTACGAKIPPAVDDRAMRAAMNIAHDLHEGYVPGCGKLSLADMAAAREHIASIIRIELNASREAP